MEKDLKPGRFLKERIVKEYTDRLKEASSFFITDFSGLTNKQLEELRAKLRETSTKYMIVKNSLCRIALKDVKIKDMDSMIDGACGLGLANGDPVSISKIFVDFSKKNDNLQLKGGYIDGELLNEQDIKELAQLPSREELLARLVMAINAPISGFVGVCSGMLKKLLYALNDIVNKKQEGK
jgi:large subunit ribosomal protein L10